MTAPARRLGALAEIRVGVTVWTDPVKARNSHDEALGGIVLEIIDSIVDLHTGELDRRFRCYDGIAGGALASRFTLIHEHDVNQDGVEPTDSYRLRTAARTFAAWLGKGRGGWTSWDAQLARDINTISRVLMGGV